MKKLVALILFALVIAGTAGTSTPAFCRERQMCYRRASTGTVQGDETVGGPATDQAELLRSEQVRRGPLQGLSCT